MQSGRHIDRMQINAKQHLIRIDSMEWKESIRWGAGGA